ncbi:MAG: DoxX family protein [Chitinophagales bacterium]
MKKTKIIYWILTGLFGAFMLFSAVPDILVTKEAITFMTDHMGYPTYIIGFIGVAKLLGVITIVVPRFPRLKEWAYAGLSIDLLGAAYSQISLGDPLWGVFFTLGVWGVGMASYFLYHKIQRGNATA